MNGLDEHITYIPDMTSRCADCCDEFHEDDLFEIEVQREHLCTSCYGGPRKGLCTDCKGNGTTMQNVFDYVCDDCNIANH